MSLRIKRADWLLANTQLHLSDKVLSLALNRYADKGGYCWPSEQRMKKDCALSVRQIVRSISNLERNGVIRIFTTDKGTRSGNFYRMIFPEGLTENNAPDRKLPLFYPRQQRRDDAPKVPATGDRESTVPGQDGLPTGDTVSVPPGQDGGPTGDRVASPGVTGCPPELKDFESVYPESFKGKGCNTEAGEGENNAQGPACSGSAPHPSMADDVILLYHTFCPALPRMKRISKRRIRRIVRMAKVLPESQSPDWWRNYFQKVSLSSFLTGKSMSGWRATLDWLLNPENAARILDGNYDTTCAPLENQEKQVLDYVEEMTKTLKGDVEDDI